MKCPKCGYWNRSSFPKCYRCGTALEPESTVSGMQRAEEVASFLKKAPPAKKYIRMDEEGKSASREDERDLLAEEMILLQKRKDRGRIGQRRLRSTQYGNDPTARFSYGRDDAEADEAERDASADAAPPEAAADTRLRNSPCEPHLMAETWKARRERGSLSHPPEEKIRITRHLLSARVLKSTALLLMLAAAAFGAYHWFFRPLAERNRPAPLTELVEISPSILGDYAAHTVKIPGEEGQSIYIKELRRSFTVTGGYAIIEVPDYIWYENSQSVTDPSVSAAITPYLVTAAGEHIQMDQISYEVDIPESTLILVTPNSGYAEVSTAVYNIQFRVEKNSTVTINGEDFSDLVSAQNGLISYNATVQPIGYNYFEIRTRSQYYRENTQTVVIYRAVQDIPLDLSTTLNNRSSQKTMKISATTLPGAVVKVETPHENLDLTRVASSGEFSFEAVFETIGTNTITITASYPGKETTVVNYDVYYLPPAADYTRLAWPLDTAWHYSDLLSNISSRVANSQIYVCKGTIVSIISESPQLAIMETGDENSSRQVLLENRSTDTWVVGTRYRVYADVFGLYNGIPRMVGRYTYQ